MKIKTYQYGGVYYQPLINQHKWGVSTSGSQASQKSGESDLEDDMMKTIQDVMSTSGLRSDLMIFNNSLKNIFSKQNLWKLQMAETLGGSGFNANKMSIMLGMYADLLTQSKVIQTNYKQYENAQQNLDEKGAWSNIAIDMSGLMWCLDQDGNLQHVSPEEYGKNQDKYKVLTNAQLMDLRANSPLFGSTNSSFSGGEYEAYGQSEGYHMLASVNDVISKGDMTKNIQSLITNLGTHNISDYGVKSGSQTSDGLEALSIASADGLYKIKRMFQGGATTVRLENGKEYTVQDISSALNFIANSLSNREKAYLMAEGATTKQYAENPSQYVNQFILDALTANLDSSYDPELVENLDPGLGGGAGGGSSKTVETTRAQFWAVGLSHEHLQRYTLQSGDENSIPISVYGLSGGSIQSKDGLSIGTKRFDRLVTESPDFLNVDLDKIQYGDVKIDKNDLNKFVYNGGTSYRVNMPVTDDGHADFGEFERLQEFNKDNNLSQPIAGNEFREMYNKAKATNPTLSESEFAEKTWLAFLESKAPAIAQKIKEYNNNHPRSKWMYDPFTGQVRSVRTEAFMMVQAYTYDANRRGMWSSDQADAIEHSKWLMHMKESDAGIPKGFNDLIGNVILGEDLKDDDIGRREAKGKKKKNLMQGFLIMPIRNTLTEQGNALLPANSLDYNVQEQRLAQREYENSLQGYEEWSTPIE